MFFLSYRKIDNATSITRLSWNAQRQINKEKKKVPRRQIKLRTHTMLNTLK